MLIVAVATALACAHAAVPFNQIVALNELFSDTGGKEWRNNSNWGIGDPCSNAWFGVECSNGVMYGTCGIAVRPPW
jgi:hypothetical protein